ncbi:MAG: basic amino acid ABC transporter substrate-binding protein [Clostridia bacterium]|nr:basic amino acid ABC transporter substrate-binding protein [Clostridia bacterium]MBQ6805618.1 basic amino acid ABC transporter substrate-binding protein [Clostridia bacterium]
MKKLIALFAALMMICCCAMASAETIVVATNPEYPPFEYVEGDEIVGYDIDMIEAIAAKAGFEIEYSPMDFDAVIAAVATDFNTIGVSGISITDERKLSVLFSDGYINAGLVVIVKADSGYETTEQLKGKLIGVQLGTTSDFAAEEITGPENVQQYKTFLNAIMDLQGNKIDAVIIDKPVGQAIMASLNDPNLVMVDMGLQADWYGIEINMGNVDLQAKINKALAELQAEGFFDQLAVKYFSAAEEAAE